jgi:hypothetical protein
VRSASGAARAPPRDDAAALRPLADLSVKLEQLACGLLRATPAEETQHLLHSGLAAHRGRTVLELAVELRRTLFLATPEAQIVTNRVWRGRALTSWEALDAEPQDDGASSPRIKPDADTAEGAGQRASVLSCLTRARSSGRHPAFWVYVWPLFAAAALPLLALAPPQMLRERIFKQLYSPAERYWAAQACYVCFVILLLHLESCDTGPGCGACSCSAACVAAHKAAAGCAGKRRRAAFVPLKAFDDATLRSDLRLLEETQLAAERARRARTSDAQLAQGLPRAALALQKVRRAAPSRRPLRCFTRARACGAAGGARERHGAAVPGAGHGAARGQHQRHQAQEQGALRVAK